MMKKTIIMLTLVVLIAATLCGCGMVTDQRTGETMITPMPEWEDGVVDDNDGVVDDRDGLLDGEWDTPAPNITNQPVKP